MTMQLHKPEPEPADKLHRLVLSVVTPAYNESENLTVLYDRISNELASLKMDGEWVVIDDHSGDDTFDVLKNLAARDSRVRGIRFARNFGSHIPLMCGLHQAKGDCAVV